MSCCSWPKWSKEVGGIIEIDDIEELDHIHSDLDRSVLDAYGWPVTMPKEQILQNLMALNIERSKNNT